jgi:predicted site-specific integrase-resolvase
MPEHNAQVGNVYTAKEVAERLRVDIITVYRWTRNGALKQGVDFFVLPHAGKRRSVRFTQAQYNRIVGNPPSQA